MRPSVRPEHVSWIGGHFPLVNLCSFFVKGHGEGAGVFVLRGHTPPVAPSSVNGHREPRPHGPAFLRGDADRRVRARGMGQGPGDGAADAPRDCRAGERAGSACHEVFRSWSTAPEAWAEGAEGQVDARGQSTRPPSPGGTGLGRPWLPPGTQGGRNSRRPPPPGLTVVRPRDSGDSASPEATEMR